MKKLLTIDFVFRLILSLLYKVDFRKKKKPFGLL